MTSVLGKLICKELGREKYRNYIRCLKEKQSAAVFCDIYRELSRRGEDVQTLMLLRLLDTVQQSVKISRRFSFMVLCYMFVMAALFFMLPFNLIFATAVTVCTIGMLYKWIEFMINRYCDKDIRMILIYKSVLFHLLEEQDRREKNTKD